MKRIISLLLITMLLLSLFAACGKDKKINTEDLEKLPQSSKTESKADDKAKDDAKTDEKPATNTNKPEDITNPSAADNPESKSDGIRYVGDWNGNTFSNKWSGVSFTMPDDDYLPEEDMNDYNGLSRDATIEDFENLYEIYDAVCYYESVDMEVGMGVLYLPLNGQNAEKCASEYIENNLEGWVTLTDNFTRKIGGKTYTAVDGYDYSDDCYADFTSVNYRQVDNCLVLVIFRISDYECNGTPVKLYNVVSDFFPDVQYTNDFAELPDNENCAVPASGIAYRPGEWDDVSYYSEYSGLFFYIPDGWNVMDEDSLRDLYSGGLVGDDYLYADTVDMIGEFFMYNDAETEGMMVMFLNTKVTDEFDMSDMSVDEILGELIEEMDGTEVNSGDVYGISDYDGRYIDAVTDDGMSFTAIGFLTDDGMLCYITILAESVERLDPLFNEIFFG